MPLSTKPSSKSLLDDTISAEPAPRLFWLLLTMLIVLFSLVGCLSSGLIPPQENSSSSLIPEQIANTTSETGRETLTQPARTAGQSTSSLTPDLPATSASTDVPDNIVTILATPAAAKPPPVLGGADKIAFINTNDVWIANLDGTGLARLTDDGQPKSNLNWSSDGQTITFISEDKCQYRVGITDHLAESLFCFPFAQYFRDFAVSPDGSKVALSVDNWLYILPNDLDLIKTLTKHSVLTDNASCEYFDPYEKDPDHKIITKYTLWSSDGQRLAIVTHSVDSQVGDVSIVRVVSYDDCKTAPQALDSFPAWHLLPEEYQHYPALYKLAWDGGDLFAFVAITDWETGVGGLFFYDTASQNLNGPVHNFMDCCYRDPNFSPDGSQLLFAYQAEPPDGDLRFYLSSVEADAGKPQLISLPLPGINPLTTTDAAFRPVLSTMRP